MLKQDVGDHQWRVIYCNAEYLNFGTQNLRPSNVKVIFQQPSCSYPYSSGFRFHCQYCPCVWNWLLFLVCRLVIRLKVVIFSVLSPMFATVANVEALPLAWRTAVNRKKMVMVIFSCCSLMLSTQLNDCLLGVIFSWTIWLWLSRIFVHEIISLHCQGNCYAY